VNRFIVGFQHYSVAIYVHIRQHSQSQMQKCVNMSNQTHYCDFSSISPFLKRFFF